MIVARWANAFFSVSRSWKPAGISVMVGLSVMLPTNGDEAATRQRRHARHSKPEQGPQPMQFGIAIPTAADSWRLVRRAEELGFSHAWFFDTQMLNADPFVAMTAAAMQTTKINLGTGVLIPSNRIAP